MQRETFCEAVSSLLFALLLPSLPLAAVNQLTVITNIHMHRLTRRPEEEYIGTRDTQRGVIHGTSFYGIGAGQVQLDTQPQLTTKYFGTKQSLSSLLSKAQTMKSNKLLFHTQPPKSAPYVQILDSY
jgi:hypothetical protein